jgi:hypothetical protein
VAVAVLVKTHQVQVALEVAVLEQQAITELVELLTQAEAVVVLVLVEVQELAATAVLV